MTSYLYCNQGQLYTTWLDNVIASLANGPCNDKDVLAKYLLQLLEKVAYLHNVRKEALI